VVGAAVLVLSGKAADLWGKKRTLFAIAVFGSIGSSLATALATPILSGHPFQVVATPPAANR